MMVEARISSNVTDAIDSLRMLSFPGAYPDRTSRSPFDLRSIHLSFIEADSLAAYVRLTRGPDAVFEAWTQGAADIPTGPGVVDLSRSTVSPSYRRRGLLRLICLEALRVAEALGASHAVGGVIPGEPFEHVFHDIGLLPSGPTVDEFEPGGVTCTIQPLVCDLAATAPQRARARSAALLTAGKDGIHIDVPDNWIGHELLERLPGPA